MTSRAFSIAPWDTGDRELLGRLLGDARMMTHLGGPESAEKLDERQSRYQKAGSGMYRVLVGGEPAGSVGYWERALAGRKVWEVGWAVVPEFQGRGVATEGMRILLDVMSSDGLSSEVHAFPSVENEASNAVCRKLGFELVGPFDFEYPPDHPLRCNDWRLDLRGRGQAPAAG